MRRAAPLLWIVLALLATPPDAAACSCISPAPPCQAVWDSPTVFSGEVVEITTVPPSQGYGRQRVRFRVEQMWRGDQASEIVVMTGAGGGDCGYRFEPGGRYLVYTYSQGGVPWTGICSRTQRLQTATEDVQYLASLQSGSPGGRIFGSATLSPRAWPEGAKLAAAAGYEVTLRGNGREWKTKTDESGGYVLLAMQPGTYEISIKLQPGDRVYGPTTVELLDVRGCRRADFSIQRSGPAGRPFEPSLASGWR